MLRVHPEAKGAPASWGRPARPGVFALSLLAFAACVTVAIYHDTAGYGLNYDDYHFVRPYQTAEVRDSFAGTWDPSHIEVPFYRPLTVVVFAARFRLFGFHAAWYHWATILLFAVVAALVGLVVQRTTGRKSFAILSTAIITVHPAMVNSMVAWITNQMHLVETLLVLAAYLAWFSVRRAKPAAWWLVAIPSCAALFVKEDAVMLPITVLLVHGLYRRLVDRSLPPVPRWFVAASLLAPAAFAWVRYEMLGGLGGYGRPTIAIAVSRIRSTIWSVLFQLSGRRPIQRVITVLLEGLLPLGAIVALVRGGVARFVVLAGASVLICFSLPFAFATKAQQVHLAALGTCLLLTGAIAAIGAIASGRLFRVGYWIVVAGFLGLNAWVSHADVAGFAPDAPYTLYTDGIVKDWPLVPEEIKAMLARKRPGGPRLEVDDLPVIMCGLGETQPADDGRPFRWSSGTIEVFTKASGGSMTLRLRTLLIPAIGRNVVRVLVDAQGFRPRLFLLADEGWKSVSIPFSRRWFLPAGIPTIRILVDPTFEPAKVFKNRDSRTLGVQVADVQLH